MPVHKFLARRRIQFSQLFVLSVILIPCMGQSVWTQRNPLMGSLLFLAGVMLVAAGVMGRVWCLSYISGKKSKSLIRSGPYSLSRNPLYLFSLLAALGVCLCTRTFTLPAMIAAGFALYYPSVIRTEEEKLHGIFGADFEAYLREVPRFFPSTRHFVEDEELEISGSAFRKGIVHLAFFIIFIGLFELVNGLHLMGLLPSYYLIY